MVSATLEFVGTATTILRLGPFTILTDPNFLHRGQRAYLGKGFFSTRLTEPSRRVKDLPALDLVVLSHLHGDHFDRTARAELDRSLPVLSTTSAADRLRKWGFENAAGLATWESTSYEDAGHRLSVRAVPGQHGKGVARALVPPVMGTVLELESPDGQPLRVYVSGDTLYSPTLAQITERCGPVDAAVVHLGGTRLLGLTVTMDDRQGADLLQLLTPRVAVPVHYDDYGVFKSPLSAFVDTCGRRGVATQLRVVRRGETVSLQPDYDGGST
ncbi:MBL fold metallo-hydrolase [Nocardioides sp. URHA0020]|uniref:MBL fold metallo-hydrolase n=1 Tax=Nocardioides sp. URHA0020 TaxID=1380392 RepID=UPI00048DBB32|nr:MBL fold metallo-hydrolase [Nocardioides sp. URHA0020]